MTRSLAVLTLVCLVFTIPHDVYATHSRDNDASARIDGNGVVTVTVRTRWRKGAAPFPFAGVDPGRFGISSLSCPSDQTGGPGLVLPEPVGMRVVRVADGQTVFNFAPTSFTLADTTDSTDTSDPLFDRRTQVLIIPLGTTADPGQVNPPLNQGFGLYDIIWTDYARISGIRNMEDPTQLCFPDGRPFGFRVRASWDGTANSTPVITGDVQTTVPRGFDYAQNLNIFAPSESLLYRMVSASPGQDAVGSPEYASFTEVPGITLDRFGNIEIPASQTSGLLDNFFDPGDGGDYVLTVEAEDIRGSITVRQILFDVVSTSNQPPSIDSIGHRIITVGDTLTFDVTASDPDAAQSLTLSASGLLSGVTFSPSVGNPVVSTFTWTPTASQVGTLNILFRATDDGSPPLADDEFVRIEVWAPGNQEPVLEEIANLRVGVDPAGVLAFVNETLTFDAGATDPNDDPLFYTGPIFVDPFGLNVQTRIGVIQTTDPLGRAIGRYTFEPTAADVGVWDLTVRVDDPAGGFDEHHVFISVGTFANQSPVFDTPPPPQIVVTVGTTISFPLLASDPDPSQQVRIETSGAPAGSSAPSAAGNPASATFTWTPAPGQAGDYVMDFEATDDSTPNITEVVGTIIHVNGPPVAGAGPPQVTECTGIAGTTVTLDGSGSTDPNPLDTLSFTWTGPFGTATGVGPAVELPLGVHTITLVVNDGTVDSSPDTVLITIEDTTPPVIVLTDPITVEGNTLGGHDGGLGDLDVFATDACGTVTLDRTPPGVLPLGPTIVTWTADDGNGNVALLPQTVTVEDTTAPTITAGDITIAVADRNQADPPAGNGGHEVIDFTLAPFNITAFDLVDGDLSGGIVFLPPLPNIFLPGVTEVTLTVIDSSANPVDLTIEFKVNNTPVGTNVVVPLTGGPDFIEVTFVDGVTAEGATTVTRNDGSSAPPIPDGFEILGQAPFTTEPFFDITSDAPIGGTIFIKVEYNDTGLSSVEQEEAVRLFHAEDPDLDGILEFVDITDIPGGFPITGPNPGGPNLVRGDVSAFSPFVILVPERPEVDAPPPITIQADQPGGASSANPVVDAFLSDFIVIPRGADLPADVTTNFTLPDGTTVPALPAVFPLGTTTVTVTATDIDSPAFFDTNSSTLTVELAIESPEPGTILLEVGESLDVPLVVNGLGSASSSQITLDGLAIDPLTTELSSSLLGSLGLPTLGRHSLEVVATDAAGDPHSADVDFEVVLNADALSGVLTIKPESLRGSKGTMTVFLQLPNPLTGNPLDPTFEDVVLESLELTALDTGRTATPSKVKVESGKGGLKLKFRRADLAGPDGSLGTRFQLTGRFFSTSGPSFQAFANLAASGKRQKKGPRGPGGPPRPRPEPNRHDDG